MIVLISAETAVAEVIDWGPNAAPGNPMVIVPVVSIWNSPSWLKVLTTVEAAPRIMHAGVNRAGSALVEVITPLPPDEKINGGIRRFTKLPMRTTCTRTE